MTASQPRPSRRALLRGTAALTAGAAITPALSACGGTASGKTQLDYWLWDANQLPGYAQSIDLFMKDNPDIDVRITQMGWSDYWTKLTASFVAEAGPDVFTDHLGRYPELLKMGVLAPLNGHAPIDAIPGDHFQPGLQELWTGQDGKRYGMPKDYDTVALLYDVKVVEKAGVSAEDLAAAEWNAQDGGTFEQILRRLTVDAAGKRADEDGFDPGSVQRFGMASNGTEYTGQTSWSPFAFSTGWQFTDKPTWGTRFAYDDERFAQTMDWYFGLAKKGLFPPFGMFGDSSPAQIQIQTGRAALAVTGSWMIGTFAALDGVELGIAPLPRGPIGTPMSMFNGLGDSISAQSEHKEEAARLIAHLASDASQEIIGKRAVVFPSTDAGTQAAIDSFSGKGLDVSPYTDRVKEKQTGLYPLVENSAAISTIMQPAFEQCWMGRITGADFKGYNDRVNALFQ